jgi:putative acetyltransferase
MTTLVRAEWTDPDLQRLVAAQEAEVIERYGDEMAAQPLEPGTVSVGLLVRDDAGEAVGCGVLRDPAPAFQAGTAELNRMYVVPEQRRRGLAKVILRELEAIAVQRKVNQLVLETGVLLEEAIGLYSSEGYRIIDNYEPYEDSEDSRCFAKAL